MRRDKKIQATVSVLIFLTIALSGCIQQTIMQEKLISAKSESLALTLDDLPEGYTQCGNSTDHYENLNGFSSGYNLKDSYEVNFKFGNCSNGSKYISSTILIFSTSKEAMDYMQKYSILGNYGGTIIELDNNLLGNYSVLFGLFELGSFNENIDRYVFCFRIFNCISIVFYDLDDFQFTYNLSKIIEGNINDSLLLN